MAVPLAAFGKGAFIHGIGSRLEHSRVLAVARHALAPQVGDGSGKRRSTEARPDGARRAPSSRRGGRSIAVGSRPPRADPFRTAAGYGPGLVADMARLLGGPHHADEGPRALAAGPAGRRRVVKTRRALKPFGATALEALKCLHNVPKAPATGVCDVGEFINLPNHLRLPDGRAFILPSMGRVHVPSLRHTQSSPTTLQSAIAHCNRPLSDSATNSPSDCGTRPVQSLSRRSFVGRCEQRTGGADWSY